jgi:hypothetical protein
MAYFRLEHESCGHTGFLKRASRYVWWGLKSFVAFYFVAYFLILIATILAASDPSGNSLLHGYLNITAMNSLGDYLVLLALFFLTVPLTFACMAFVAPIRAIIRTLQLSRSGLIRWGRQGAHTFDLRCDDPSILTSCTAALIRVGAEVVEFNSTAKCLRAEVGGFWSGYDNIEVHLMSRERDQCCVSITVDGIRTTLASDGMRHKNLIERFFYLLRGY